MNSINEQPAWMEITLTIPAALAEDCSVILFEETGRGTYQVDPEPDSDGPQRIRGFVPRMSLSPAIASGLKRRSPPIFRFFRRSPSRLGAAVDPFGKLAGKLETEFQTPEALPDPGDLSNLEDYRPEGREKVLRLDPGQAFGTGGHASTRLCLKVLECLSEETDSLRQPLTRVLDVGTGTGILALAAALFHARSVLAIDSDPLAVAAARLHVSINGFESIIRVEEATAEIHPGCLLPDFSQFNLGRPAAAGRGAPEPPFSRGISSFVRHTPFPGQRIDSGLCAPQADLPLPLPGRGMGRRLVFQMVNNCDA